jgi:hypothetical protein
MSIRTERKDAAAKIDLKDLAFELGIPDAAAGEPSSSSLAKTYASAQYPDPGYVANQDYKQGKPFTVVGQ